MTGAAAVLRDVARRLEPRRDHLRVVPERSRVGLGVVIMVSLLFSTFFLLAVMQAMLVQDQLEIDQNEEVIAELEDARRHLQFEVSLLEAPDVVAAQAEARGMVRPGKVLFVEAVKPVPFDPNVDGARTPAQDLAKLLALSPPDEVVQE